MKFYIISDKVNVGIAISNIVNSSGNTAIMSENILTMSGQVEDLKRVSRGYDFYIIVSQTPNRAGIEANKIDGIRAVVSGEPESIQKALEEADANTIVVDSSSGKQIIGPMIKEFVQCVSGQGEQQRPAKLPRIEKPQKPKQKKIAKQEEDEEEQREEKSNDVKEERQETEESDTGPKGGGILGRIKYEFGLD